MSGFAIETAAQEAPVSPSEPTIERLTIRRRGVGLRGYDPKRAFTGFTLFSPLPTTNKTVYLVDMLGNVAHTWNMPYPPGQSGYLTERGTLFYNGQIPNESHVGKAPYRGGAALEMDWRGRILWEVNHPDHNHDGIRLKNGNVLLICQKPLPAEIVPKVRGGRPGSEYDDGKMDAPYLVEMTIKGQIVWEWRSWEHLNPGEDVITAVQDDRDVWTVANGVSEMPDGNLLVSFRDISTVVMVNRRTGAIYWKLGAPPLSGQHAPHILSNGNVLLFDNGPHRLDHSFPFRACSKSIRRRKRSCGNIRRLAFRISSVPGFRTLSVCQTGIRSSTRVGLAGSSRSPARALSSGSTLIRTLARGSNS